MFTSLRRWRRRRRLRNLDTSAQAWRDVWDELPVLQGLDAAASERLRCYAALLAEEKSWCPVAGFRLPPGAERTIALLAALPVLNLGLEWLDDFVTVVVYPDSFVAEFEEQEEDTGVVHRYREPRSGESWQRGPLILSWSDVGDSRALDGFNVVLHEVAHKLDGGDGAVNGRPPLHADMDPRAWSDAFLAAYAAHRRALEQGDPTSLDDYAAEAPEEFFAVASEAFFETPHRLLAEYPEVYRQLAAFYRQDPARRLPAPAD